MTDDDDDNNDDILVEYKIKMSLSKPLRHIRRERTELKVKLLSLLTSAIDGVVSFKLRLVYHQGKRQNSVKRHLRCVWFLLMILLGLG